MTHTENATVIAIAEVAPQFGGMTTMGPNGQPTPPPEPLAAVTLRLENNTQFTFNQERAKVLAFGAKVTITIAEA